MSGVILFEFFIIFVTLGLWYTFKRQGKHGTRMIVSMFLGVLLFEMLAYPMWHNFGYSAYTYIGPVNWIVTLGWANIFLVSLSLVDYTFHRTSEGKKFWLYIIFMTIITTPIEVAMLNLGIRSYDSILTSTLSGASLPFTLQPIEIFLVLPLVGALVFPFYKYLMKHWIKK